jgi:hypothetical protein
VAIEKRMVRGILAIPGARINGPDWEEGAPHILNVYFEGVDRGEVLVHMLEEKGIYVSTGSACHSRRAEPSHVLKAMGLKKEGLFGAIRISLSPFNTLEQIQEASGAFSRSGWGIPGIERRAVKMESVLVVRYGEISLKGKNRRIFEDLLLRRMKEALEGLPPRKIWKTYGRIYVELFDDASTVMERLAKVFGIFSFSPARLVSLDLDAIREAALLELRSCGEGGTFKVETKRPEQDLPFEEPGNQPGESGAIISWKIQRTGRWTSTNPRSRVRLGDPGRRSLHCIPLRKPQGLGGLPVGSTGRALLLISGGIDSPVAGWLAMKRGIQPVGLAFLQFSFYQRKIQGKGDGPVPGSGPLWRVRSDFM